MTILLRLRSIFAVRNNADGEKAAYKFNLVSGFFYLDIYVSKVFDTY